MPGRWVVAAGHWVGRHLSWRVGARISDAGVRRHCRLLDRELDRRAAAARHNS